MGDSAMLESPSSPGAPLPALGEAAHTRPPIPVLQGVLAQALCQEQLLLLSPPPPPLLLPPLGKEGQPQGAPWPPQQGACSPPQPPPPHNMDPTARSPKGMAGPPRLCC